MSKFNQREYQTVIMGALLHDVGKFLNRGTDVRRKHPYFSADYVSSEQFKSIIKEDWIDIELLKILVQCHHEHPLMPDELLVQKIKDLHIRKLAYIVSRADSYSSGERVDEEPAELNYKQVRLVSIFSKLKKNTNNNPPFKYYRLQKMSPDVVFPVEDAELYQLTYNYDKLLQEFGNAFKLLKPKDFDALFNGYLSIFEEFLWCVPSDTRDKYNDISLYDHLSTTSAIAACLYQYHFNNFDEDKITDDTIEKCMLVGGDLSGIQRFIFEIGTTNPKKLSKVLRGRSFYLSLLTEVASLKILRRLKLPISCRIMNAGGRFALLVPNTPFVENEIKTLQREIEEWFYKIFLGKLSLNIVWGITLSKDGFTSEGFSKKQKELSNALELSKKRRFNNIIPNYESLHKPMKEALEILQKDRESCDFCKIYPRVNGKSRCQTCLDSEEIGRFLVSESLIYFYEGSKQDGIDIMGYTISFKNKGDDWILLEKISDKGVQENHGYITRHISNYIPESQEGDIDLKNEKPENGNTLCRYCGSPCKIEGDDKEEIPPRRDLVRNHLTFQCISAFTRKENDGKCVDHLAIIKADVDDLGFLFSHGLGDMLSISRYASLSRMLNYFFTGWLTHEIKENHRMVYTVYAGGDDLLLISPWEDALNFGSQIGTKFKSYVADNPDITISMGINLMRPNSPVGLAAEVAEENLERSKENSEKNKLTVFSTTISWREFNKLKEVMKILNNALNDENEKVRTSFLYRMLKYHEMYKDFSERNLIEGLKFHSAMSRDVRRNIERRDKYGNVLNPILIETLRPLYAVGDGFDKELMHNLKIPVFWTLYKNRGGAK